MHPQLGAKEQFSIMVGLVDIVCRAFRRVALPFVLLSGLAMAQDLKVTAYSQQGNPLSGAQVTLNGKFGKVRGLTNSNGEVVFKDISDTLTVQIAKNNFIGARHQLVVNSNTGFNGVLVDKKQVRSGINGTGVDTVDITSGPFWGVFDLRPNIKKNPVLFDVKSSWPNYNIPVDVQGFSTADSIKIWTYLNWRNDFSGKTIFVPGKVNIRVDKGILVVPSSTEYDYTGNFLYIDNNGEYKIFNSVCFLTRNFSRSLTDYVVLHETAWHGLADATDPYPGTVGYSPSNYNSDRIRTTSRDAVYMDLGYLLQFLRQTNKSHFDMIDYNDNIVVTGNVSPTVPLLAGPVDGDSVNASRPVIFKWFRSFDSDNDRVSYKWRIVGPGLDSLVTDLYDTLVVLAPNKLQNGASYVWSVTATDNLSDNVSVTRVLYSRPDQSPFRPVLLAPVYDARVFSPVDFRWSKFVNANNPVTYVLNVRGVRDTSIAGLVDTLRSLNLPKGSYSWFVTASDGLSSVVSDTSIFTIPNSVPSKPVLVSPLNVAVTSPVTFVWRRSVDADNDPLTYSVAYYGTYNNGVVGLTDTVYSAALPRGRYRWAVWAGDGITQNVSSTGAFSVNVKPSSFSFTNPSLEDSVRNNTTIIPIAWTRATDADNDSLKYLIRIAGPGLDTLITTPYDTASITSRNFRSLSTYLITGRVTDGIDTVAASNSKTILTASTITSVKIDDVIPTDYELSHNYPNPFNPVTSINYSLKRDSHVRFGVYNMVGQLVREIDEGVQRSGRYNELLDMNGLSSGVYFLRMTANPTSGTEKPYIKTIKIILQK